MAKKMVIVNFEKSTYLIFMLMAVILAGCSSADSPELKTAEGVFVKAMKLYEDEDYLEAKQMFDVIKLQYPASQYADDAQYYLAECNFKREEYVIGAFNYNMLRRVYPNSPYYKESMFKAGLCYYYLSPEYDRDQENTYKAIKAMSEFQAIYPNDSLGAVNNQYLNELRNKLGEREFFTAQLYRNLRSPNSALIYYNGIIDKYDDTKFYEPSYLGKIEVLIEMKKYKQALGTIDLYLSIFKNGEFVDKVKKLESSIPEEEK